MRKVGVKRRGGLLLEENQAHALAQSLSVVVVVVRCCCGTLFILGIGLNLSLIGALLEKHAHFHLSTFECGILSISYPEYANVLVEFDYE